MWQWRGGSRSQRLTAEGASQRFAGFHQGHGGPRGPPRRCLAEDDKSEETFETHPNRTCTTVPGGAEHLALAMEAIGDQVVIGDTEAGAQHEPGRGEPFQGSLIA